jgi:hypothetical protein
MHRRSGIFLFALFVPLLITAAGPAFAQAPPPPGPSITPGAETDYRAGRVSDVRGSLALRGMDEDDVSYVERNSVIREGDTLWTDAEGRAEIELVGGSWLRLAEDTKVELRHLPPNAEFHLWTGSIYLDLTENAEGVRVRTPSGDVEIQPDSVVRVDLGESESVRVTVQHGHARVIPERGDPVRLIAGQRTYLQAEQPAEAPTTFARDDQDGFDTFHRSRVDYFVTRPVPQELERDIIGARELSEHGEWLMVEGQRHWRPRGMVADWRPYMDGYWGFTPGFGYTWIDYAPWGFATAHYGGWRHMPVHGWLWHPGYMWHPSLVHWGTFPGYFGWAPLDPWGMPVWGGPGFGSGFRIGFGGRNFFIDFASWTFAPRDRFFFARHHRQFGAPCFYGGRQIGLNAGGFQVVRNVHRDIGVPRHRVRGLTTLANGRLARDHVTRLDGRLPARRLDRIERRFDTPGRRDLDIARRPSPVQSVQRDLRTRVDENRIVRGAEGERFVSHTPRSLERVSRDAGLRRPVADRADRGGNDGARRGDGGRPTDGREAGNRDGRQSDGRERGEPGGVRRGDGAGRATEGRGPGERPGLGDVGRGEAGSGGVRGGFERPGANAQPGERGAGRQLDLRPGERTPTDDAARRPGGTPRDALFRRGEGSVGSGGPSTGRPGGEAGLGTRPQPGPAARDVGFRRGTGSPAAGNQRPALPGGNPGEGRATPGAGGRPLPGSVGNRDGGFRRGGDPVEQRAGPRETPRAPIPQPRATPPSTGGRPDFRRDAPGPAPSSGARPAPGPASGGARPDFRRDAPGPAPSSGVRPAPGPASGGARPDFRRDAPGPAPSSGARPAPGPASGGARPDFRRDAPGPAGGRPSAAPARPEPSRGAPPGRGDSNSFRRSAGSDGSSGARPLPASPSPAGGGGQYRDFGGGRTAPPAASQGYRDFGGGRTAPSAPARPAPGGNSYRAPSPPPAASPGRAPSYSSPGRGSSPAAAPSRGPSYSSPGRGSSPAAAPSRGPSYSSPNRGSLPSRGGSSFSAPRSAPSRGSAPAASRGGGGSRISGGDGRISGGGGGGGRISGGGGGSRISGGGGRSGGGIRGR